MGQTTGHQRGTFDRHKLLAVVDPKSMRPWGLSDLQIAAIHNPLDKSVESGSALHPAESLVPFSRDPLSQGLDSEGKMGMDVGGHRATRTKGLRRLLRRAARYSMMVLHAGGTGGLSRTLPNQVRLSSPD